MYVQHAVTYLIKIPVVPKPPYSISALYFSNIVVVSGKTFLEFLRHTKVMLM